LKDLIERVKESEKIKLCLNATIKAVDGYVGNYKTTISSAQGEIVYEHGVAIIATGGNEYKPEEYLYGESPKVITQRELEERIVKGELGEVGSVVMIQCVGSREPQRPYCSRYCCSAAVKNALKLKEINPRVDIYILYRDIRTYGFKEDYYRRAREQGVVFLRYSEDDKPCVSSVNGRVKVLVRDRVLKERLEFSPDLLVLSTAIVPQRDNDELAKMFKLPLNAEKFFLEAHVKLRPVEFATDGVFLAGLCHAPKGVSESIDQAAAAAAKAATILSKDHIESESQVCQVDETRCTACGSCVPVCAFNALEIAVVDERSGKRAAKLNEALCKGCGACAATCRCGALDIRGYTNEQIFEMIESF
jgi:heterodisulfide reductase subunit A